MSDVRACALVSGASRGIGRAIARQLSRDHGLHILLNYASNTAAAEASLQDILEQGGSGELLPCRVEDKAEVDQAMNTWMEAHPNSFIQVLVNNAGIAKDGLFMWMSESDWDEVMAVSVKGMFNLTRALIQPMLRKRKGRIINISSLSGVKGLPGQTNYSTAKAAMIGATKSLAQEVGKRNITVNAIAPGFIQTDMLEPEIVERFLPLIPLGRTGTAEEVAQLTSFLASDQAAYITGEVIHINGGLYT